MTYGVISAVDADVITDPDGEGVITREQSAFVVTRQCSKRDLLTLFDEFERQTSATLRDIFLMTPGELGKWHGGGKYKIKPKHCPPDACVGFKIGAHEQRRTAWLSHSSLVQAAIGCRVIPPEIVSSNGMRLRKGSGPFHELVWRSGKGSQERMLHYAFNPENGLISALTKALQQGSCFDFDSLRRSIISKPDIGSCLDFLANEFSRVIRLRKRGMNFAIGWFCFYLSRRGVWLFPRVDRTRLNTLFPRLLFPVVWSLFVSNENTEALNKLRFRREHGEKSDWLTNAHLELLLRTNFYQNTLNIDEWLLTRLKGDDMASLFLKADSRRGWGFNLYLERLLLVLGDSIERHPSLVAYFGGGGRLIASLDVFSWMTAKTRLSSGGTKSMRTGFLKRWGGVCPAHVQGWAQQLETALSLMPQKSKGGIVSALNLWVYYLLTLDEATCPRSFADVERAKHIASNVEGANTFLVFLKDSPANQRERAAKAFQQAWLLSARAGGFESDLTCPIADSDIPRAISLNPVSVRAGRTRRKSLGSEILEFVLAQNRKPDGEKRPFEFARSLNAHNRRARTYMRSVNDSKTGEFIDEFWPALPIILDMLLTTGMRTHSALWVDSGEGDEWWVDRNANEEVPNSLPSATKNRRQGFLRLVPVGPKNKVAGMYLGVNKTGAYEVPWVDTKTAEFVELMRDWQARYNSRTATVTASRSNIDKTYAAEGSLEEVYPLFRDPYSKLGHPPTWESLNRYWRELLQYCEPIFNAQRKSRAIEQGEVFQFEPFLIGDKPRWGLHNLRVTLVTTLIEAGVSPEIVQTLVGHKSLVMTYHYLAVNNQTTHDQIRRGFEARRQRAIEAALSCQDSADAGETLSRGMGGLFRYREDENIGLGLFKDCIESGGPGSFDVFSHGICPGGDCGSGGKSIGSKFGPVFRPKACSRCRYRITGPAFINGLVMRLNQLMAELFEAFEQERAFQNEKIEKEDNGSSTALIDAAINRHREFQEEVFGEWAAELVTIEHCRSMQTGVGNANKLPTVPKLDEGHIEVHFLERHQLLLLQSILSDGQYISGAKLEIPDHIRARRNEMLLEIASASGAHEFFFRLSKSEREMALDAFGKLIAAEDSFHHDDATGRLERLISGEEVSSKLHAAAEKICERVSTECRVPEQIQQRSEGK